METDKITDLDQCDSLTPAELDEAGRYVGIGDWRPAKKGMYGKFIVTKFKRMQQ